jgi:hypothetical protein
MELEKTKGKRIASPLFTHGLYGSSAYVDCDLLGFRLIGLWHVDFQYAIPVGGLDAIAFDALRQIKGSDELAGNSLDAMILNAVGWLVKLALATKAQRSVFELEIELLLFHPWNLGANQIGVSAFQDVHGRQPSSRRGGVICSGATESIVEQFVDTGLNAIQPFKRFPSH